MNNNFETNFETNLETMFNQDGTWNREHELKYSAILALDERLTEDGIPHLIDELMDGWVIIYFDDEAFNNQHCSPRRRSHQLHRGIPRVQCRVFKP